MTTKARHKFECHDDVVAIDPKAFFFDWEEPETPSVEVIHGVGIVTIRGPLSQRSGWWSDGYDAIAQRIRECLASEDAQSLLLRIDSPGGAVAGLFECVRALRAEIIASGKPCVAYADESACSAAYALAALADEIVVPATGGVGSVGVIATAVDYSKQNEKFGVRFIVVTSGAQKADLHPEVPITDEAIARLKTRVESLAGTFADWVAERRDSSVESVRALEAAVLYGQDAVNAGLADRVGGFAVALNAAVGRAEQRRKEMSMKSIAQALGLADNATETDCVAHILRAQEGTHKLCGLLGVTSTAEAFGVAAGLKAKAAQVDALSAEVTALRASQDTSERERALGEARASGRLTPGMEGDAAFGGLLKSLPTAQLKTMLGALPPQVPVATAHKPATPVGGSELLLTAEEKNIAAKLGVTEAEMLTEKQRAAGRVSH